MCTCIQILQFNVKLYVNIFISCCHISIKLCRYQFSYLKKILHFVESLYYLIFFYSFVKSFHYPNQVAQNISFDRKISEWFNQSLKSKIKKKKCFSLYDCVLVRFHFFIQYIFLNLKMIFCKLTTLMLSRVQGRSSKLVCDLIFRTNDKVHLFLEKVCY